MSSPPRSRRGLGLIELLVGVSTLSVTVGLLVPAFAQSREVSLRQAELGNLRTIINLALQPPVRETQRHRADRTGWSSRGQG